MIDARGFTYKFTDAEIEIAHIVAALRFEACKDYKPKDSKFLLNDYHGFLGELYMAKLLNVYPDFTTTKRSVELGTDEGDLRYKDKIIDVKTTTSKDGTLHVKINKVNPKVHYYSFMIVDPPLIQYMGTITKDSLCQEKNLRTTVFPEGPSTSYTVFNNKLLTDITKW